MHEAERVSTIESQAEEGLLRFVNYYIHHGCNLSCLYCRVKEQKIKPMEGGERREVFRRISRLCSRGKVLSLLGGEPTLNQDFLTDVISDGMDAGFHVTLATNGYGLDTKLIDRINELNQKEGERGTFGQIAVSVDCGSSEKTDLDKAVEILSYARSKNIVPVVSTVFTSKIDFSNFRAFVNYIIDKGIFVNPMVCSTSIENGVFSNASLSDRPTASQFRQIAPWLAWKKYSTGYITASFGYLRTLFQAGFSKDQAVWHCAPNFRSEKTAGRGFLTLDSDGHIGPCQEFPRVVNIFDISQEQLSLQFFDQKFKEVVTKCPGCSYSCYINESEMKGVGLALEIFTTFLPMVADLLAGDKMYQYRDGSRFYPFKDLTKIFPKKKV